MTLARPLGRLGARMRRLGLRATLGKMFADHVYRRSSSVVMENRAEWGEQGRDFAIPQGMTIVVAEHADELPALSDWLAHRGPAFRAMLGEGKVAVFVVEDGRATGCVWLTFRDYHDAQSREHYMVAPGEAYHFCWLVDPARRRSNTTMVLCRALLREVKRRGIRRQFSVVDRVNKPSYRIQQRFGYRECGREVIHLYLLRQRFTWTRAYQGELGLLPGAGRT